jgi:uncharacterized protein (TIGR02452 family)
MLTFLTEQSSKSSAILQPPQLFVNVHTPDHNHTPHSSTVPAMSDEQEPAGHGRGRGHGQLGRGQSTSRGGRGGGGRGQGFQTSQPNDKRSLAIIAGQTQAALPYILKDLPHLKADESELLSLDTDLPPLKAKDCPKHPKTTIKVVNDDTFDATTAMMDRDDPNRTNDLRYRPAVLNFANDVSPGGGWLKGAMAQEEALCYRSSLSLSLHQRYYPWSPLQGVYTRDVVIIRSSVDNGHKLVDPDEPASELRIVSVLSVAALRQPDLSDGQVLSGGAKQKVFAKKEDRDLTKKKMALILRMAASRGHDRLVLGAMGCGAFANPVNEVAQCWKEVFEEQEFSGGWWKEVCFAVRDPKNVGNFQAFEKTMGGLEL